MIFRFNELAGGPAKKRLLRKHGHEWPNETAWTKTRSTAKYQPSTRMFLCPESFARHPIMTSPRFALSCQVPGHDGPTQGIVSSLQYQF